MYMPSSRSNESTSRQRPTASVPLSAHQRLGSGQRPGATSRRSNYNDDRSQLLSFRSKSPDSPVEFDPTAVASNATSLSASTSSTYTHAVLPSNASADLVAATISIDDLQHMEVIYDANRKRQFQALVRRYMNQLLHGCDREGACTVPTCWTARKRLAGSGGTAGVGQGRKLTVLSARIMACTLASRDNPYEGLCDGKPVEVGLAVRDSKKFDSGKGKLRSLNRSSVAEAEGVEVTNGTTDSEIAHGGREERENNVLGVRKKRGDAAVKNKDGPKFEKGAADSGAKDTKSFPQMLFDTKPLKMLEWLSIPPPITNFHFTTSQTVREKEKKNLVDGEEKCLSETLGTSGSETGADNDDIGDVANSETSQSTEPPPKNPSDQSSSNALMFPPPPELPMRSPTPPSPAVYKRRETLHEIVTPTPHSNNRRTASEGLPQTPIAPPPIHLPQRHHRRERPAYEPPQAHYHQSQFTEHFYGLPPPQQTPSRIPVGKQAECENPFGALTPTDSSPSGSPDVDRNFLDNHFSIPRPQTLSHLNNKLIVLLAKLCIDGEAPATRHSEADMFARQSVFYCLSNPDALMRSFGLQKAGDKLSTGNFAIDPSKTDTAFRILACKWENTVLKSLWKGLEEVYKFKSIQVGEPTKSGDGGNIAITTPGVRQHLLDNFTATSIIIMSIHALAAMLPREGSKLRPKASDEEWLGMRNIRGKGLLTVDIGDCFENELAERLMKRAVRVLDYRIEQAGKGLGKGEENEVEQLLMRYIRKCALAERESSKAEETLEEAFGVKKEKLSKNWSMAGCMLEWARTVLLKDWDGKEVVKRGTVTAGALRVMRLLYENRKALYLEAEIFATPLLADRLDPKEVPVEWYRSLKNSTNSTESSGPIHLISHPFLFTPSTLVIYFRAINLSIMTGYYESALTTMSLLRQVSLSHYFPRTRPQRDKFVDEKLKIACTTYLLMGIRRQNILEDAFNGVYKRELRELMKPLKIKFLDSFEEGVDQGGPQIEFFDVLTKEVMGEGYGMFVDTDNVNHMSWFTIKPLEPLHKFELLGVLMGIAIYNGITLPVHFPLIFYKKLLGGEAADLEDIEDGWPELVKGLRQMLEWKDGDVGDIFCRTYEFAYEQVDSGRSSVDMLKAKKMGWKTLEHVENGIPLLLNASSEKGKGKVSDEDDWYTEPELVTNENRDAYIEDYLAWLTNYSVAPQFTALRQGILTVLPHLPLTSLFTPSTLKSLFEGSPTISTRALESITKYDDGYHANHPLIREFWSVVHNYSEAQKRALLEFVTASDRLPGGGVGEPGGPGAITFVIQRVGPSENLPTSMTCFGRLLLPEYEVGKGKVKDKLGRALENSRGFGII